jgi:acetyltransferase-like isoleucine patch superfamily enzyme
MKDPNRASILEHTPLQRMWIRFWMRFAGLGPMGRFATRCAVLFAHPHKARVYLARMNQKGFISPSAVIHHAQLHLGRSIFMDDRVVVFQRETGGPIELGDRVYIYRDTILETGEGGRITIGSDASVHPRCQINAYKGSIEIGSGVMIAPSCALYSYDHGVAPGLPIREQPLRSKGDIIIGDEAWLSYGVIVLGGVRIGEGAVVAAGSVVTKDIPDNAIAAGNPARVIKSRLELV